MSFENSLTSQPLRNPAPSLAQNLLPTVTVPEDFLEQPETAENRRKRQVLETRVVLSAHPTRQSESEESARANTNDESRSRRLKRGALNGIRESDPLWVRLAGGPFEFVPGLRDINPIGAWTGWAYRASHPDNPPVAPPQVDTVLVNAVEPTPKEIQAYQTVATAGGNQRNTVLWPSPPAAENGGSAFLPGAGAAPSKILVKSSQRILSEDINSYFSTTGGVKLNGENFFGRAKLDNVFRVGSGNVTPVQLEGLNNIKKYLLEAYEKSENFRSMVDTRDNLVTNQRAPRITIAMTRNLYHFQNIVPGVNSDFNAATDLKRGVSFFNADYLKNNPTRNTIFIVIDTDKNSGKKILREKTVDPREIVIHEFVHALTYSMDWTRSTTAGNARFAVANGRTPSTMLAENSLDWPHAEPAIPDDLEKISAGEIPGLHGNIYIDKKALFGETYTFTNAIMRDISPDFLPCAAYTTNFAYNSNGDLLTHEDHLRVLKYLIFKDEKADGNIDYPYSKFDHNRRNQVIMDSNKMWDNYIRLMDNYFIKSNSPHVHDEP